MKGFTLLNLLFALLLVALLLGLAYPTYQTYVVRGHHAKVKAMLLENAHFMTRWYAEHGGYRLDSTHMPSLPHTRYPEEGSTLFQVVFVANNVKGNDKRDEFTIRATPSKNTLVAAETLEIDQDGNIQICPVGKPTAVTCHQ